MKTLMPYLLRLLLPFSFYLIFIIRRKSSGDLKNLPPGSNGWPFLGENVELSLLGFPKFVKNRMKKHSPNVFQTSIFGEKVAVFCGAQGNKFVLTKDSKLVTIWLPQSFKKMLFSDLKESSHKEPVALLHKFQHDIFKLEALKQYLPVMLVSSWTMDGGLIQWRPKLWDLFDRMTKFISLPIDLPGTAFNRARKAGKMAREEMMRIVKERRKEMMMTKKEGSDEDWLSKMLVLADEDGQSVSDNCAVNFLVGLLLASYESSAYALTAVIYFLAELSHICQEVFKEQMAIAKSKCPDEVLTWDDVVKMKYSWNVARESLRLMPPSQGGFREATDEFTYAGFTIPKGWKTFWTVHSSHMNPDYFPEPEKFDPSRFEGSGPPPYTFVPFGGGARICLGRVFAKLEILVMMHNLVTRFRLEKAIPTEKMVFCGRFVPFHGLPVHLHPHQT